DLLQQFAAGSDGVFRPLAIEERRRGDEVRLRFRCGQRRYEVTVEAADRWVDVTFVRAINRALADLGEARRFVQVDLGDPFTPFRFKIPGTKAKAPLEASRKKRQKAKAPPGKARRKNGRSG